MIDTPDDSTQSLDEVAVNDAAFRCDVSFVDEHAIVTVAGELDLATGPELLREVQGALALPLKAVTVDLGGLSFMDSSGIHALLVARSNAVERGMEFALAPVSRQGAYVLEVAGLSAHFGLDAS